MGPLLPDEFNPETFPMLRVLPGLVVRTLRKHFYAGVKEAEVRFRYHRADEDAVTGALGERLIEPEPITIQVGPRAYLWRTASYKLRGRGAHAPEKEPAPTASSRLRFWTSTASSLFGRACRSSRKSDGRAAMDACSSKRGTFSGSQSRPS